MRITVESQNEQKLMAVRSAQVDDFVSSCYMLSYILNSCYIFQLDIEE